MKAKRENKTTKKVFPKKVLEPNSSAMESFEEYRKVADIIERANLAAGKKGVYETSSGSALNLEIQPHGLSTQEI